MKRKRILEKKTVAFCTAVTMLVGSTLSGPVVSAADRAKDIQVRLTQLDSTYGKSTLDKLKEKLNTTESKEYKDDDMVNVIVELKEDSLLENYAASTSNVSANKAKTFEKYMASSKAKSEARKIQREQNSTLSSIEKTVDDSEELTVKYRYSTVMNGFAIRVKYGELEKIKGLSNVQAAYVAPVFERPDPIVDKNMSSSSQMIQVNPTWDLKLKGEGTVVAILDTGLDTKHSAFQSAPANAKVTSDMVQNVINTKTLNAGVTKASNVYVNEKVPFAYDYADVDSDVNPTEQSLPNGNSHGTHVAGTIAAKSTEVTGVAPEAQLMIMKVFPDATSGAETDDIVAALEDAVELGADVINMSLGSDSGFTEEEEESVSKIYDRISESGISLAVSAGNSNSISENNARNSTTLASNPDTSTVGSPSTYAAATSVASVVNNILHSNYFVANGAKVAYADPASGAEPKFSKFANKTVDYVVVPKYGETKDYEGIDVKGKVALITRGGITFSEKVRFAADNGAIGAIILNNTAGTISMSIAEEDYKIPAVSITKADGETMKAASAKVIEVSEAVSEFDTNEGSRMSDFSSWGVSPNLDLKPEIAAPGGHIYSTLPFNAYGDMSGTSMASPHIAGTYALVKQYIKKDSRFSDLSNEEVSKLATQLLMSTSIPTKDADGVYYAPRQQGSGIVNVFQAVKTKAYLYTEKSVEENNKPKLNLYDDSDKTGKFTQSFHIKNISSEPVSYTVANTSLAETVKNVDGELVLGETPKDVSSKVAMDVSVTNAAYAEGKVTVEPGKDACITVAFTMNQELKAYYDSNFVNGGFFEGFVRLDGEDADLAIPYLGFFGDWTKAPLFDAGSVYDYKEYSQAPHAALSENEYLGVNPYDELTQELIYNTLSPYLYGEYYKDALKPDMNKIAISPNKDGVADSLNIMQLGLIRNAKELNYEIKDEKNAVVKSGKANYERKSTYYKSGVEPVKLKVDFTGMDKDGKVLPNNSVYTFTVTGKLDYAKHASSNTNDSFTVPVTIDTEAPSVSNVSMKVEDGKTYLTFKATDNQYLALVEVGIKEDGKRVSLKKEVVNEDAKNAVTEMKVDVTEQYEKYGKDAAFYIDTYDYAYNETAFRLVLVDTPQAPTTEVKVTKPAKVAGLTAKATTTNRISLTWNKVSDANGYDVYGYDSAKKAYVKVCTRNANTNSVNVTNINGKKLIGGTYYYFKVCAYKNADGKKLVGSYSNTLKTATCPDRAAVSVKAKSKKAVVSWTRCGGASGYEVYLSTNKSSGFKKVKNVSNKSSRIYTKSGLKRGKTYYFKVRAYKSVGAKKYYGSYSQVKSVKIK